MNAANQPIRVLFVCLGNICRSPMAEYVLRDQIARAGLSDRIETASAGTSGWHDGEDMHCGTADVLDQHRIASSGFTSRRVRDTDWADFDYLIAMDADNLRELEARFGTAPHKLFLLTDLVPELGYDGVPDPWYTRNFNETHRIVQAACQALLKRIQLA